MSAASLTHQPHPTLRADLSDGYRLEVREARLEGGAFVGEVFVHNGQPEPLYENFAVIDKRGILEFTLTLAEEVPALRPIAGEVAGALTSWSVDPLAALAGESGPTPLSIALTFGATLEVADLRRGADGRVACTLVKSFPNKPNLEIEQVIFDDGPLEEQVHRALNLDHYWWTKVRDTIMEAAGKLPHLANSANLANGGWEAPVPFATADVPPFPVACLPSPFREMVVAVANFTQTPEDLAAMVGLAAVAAAVRGQVIVRVKPGYMEPLVIWTMTVLGPGNRKSAVYGTMTAPLTAYEVREASRLAPAIAEARTARNIKEAALARATQEAARATGADRMVKEKEARDLAVELAAYRVPAAPQIVVDDVTPEKLAALLAEQGGAIALMSAEGGVFDLMAGRYSSGVPNLDVYLKGHAGDDLRVSRQGREPVWVPEPALTIGITVQPEVLRGAANRPDFRGRGLLGRFLYALPASRIGHRDTEAPPVPVAVTANYGTLLDAVLTLDRPDDGPHVLTFDPAAQPALMAWEREIERELGDFGTLGNFRDWGGKLFGATARIAGLLHLVRHGRVAPYGDIAAETVEAAIGIARYLIDHAAAAFAEMGADPRVEDTRYLLRAIEHHASTSFTKRTVFEWTKGRFKRVEELDPALRLASAHGYLREREAADRPGPGRRPSPVYEVNPLWTHSLNSLDSLNGAA